MSTDVKDKIILELDTRIHRLEKHKNDENIHSDNEFQQLEHAVSKILCMTLLHELTNLKEYITDL